MVILKILDIVVSGRQLLSMSVSFMQGYGNIQKMKIWSLVTFGWVNIPQLLEQNLKKVLLNG